MEADLCVRPSHFRQTHRSAPTRITFQMRSIDVCLSPELIHLYNLSDKIVVVVDVLRATSCMTTALANGIERIKPVSDLEECRALQAEGFLGAAERNGQKQEGFDFGNSPFSYIDNDVKGKQLAMTTTNGTLAINKSKDAVQVLVGSLLNLSAMAEYLKTRSEDIVVHCAGWKGRVNLEDTLYAGALIDALDGEVSLENDAAMVALATYKASNDEFYSFLSNCSHFRRLSKMNIERDLRFCLTTDEFDVIPVLEGDYLVRM